VKNCRCSRSRGSRRALGALHRPSRLLGCGAATSRRALTPPRRVLATRSSVWLAMAWSCESEDYAAQRYVPTRRARPDGPNQVFFTWGDIDELQWDPHVSSSLTSGAAARSIAMAGAPAYGIDFEQTDRLLLPGWVSLSTPETAPSPRPPSNL
jgi:hypothetical protein